MKIVQNQRDGFTLLEIEGDVDLNSSPEVRKAFDEIINSNATKVVVNFSEVPYIDSSGLATLVEMLQRLKKIEGTLYLTNLSDKIKNLFEITKLNKIFKIYENQEQIFE